MTKVPKHHVAQTIADDDIWVDELRWMDDADNWWENYWDDVHRGEMSWQWYMSIANLTREGWSYVAISPDHKSVTVINWIGENYPGCQYKHEDHHFLIEQEEVAIIVALKWA